MNPAIEIITPLTWLKGLWEGRGKATFPTHGDFDYEDHMTFKLMERDFEKEPIIHFEEIAWVIDQDKREFKHWETGFFKPESDGSIQLYICHNTGRIEIMYGKIKTFDLANRTFEVVFESASIRNDKGTKVAVASRRKFMFKDDVLQYWLGMSTEDVVEMSDHLRVEVRRVETKRILPSSKGFTKNM